jgi:hypothetical protein
MKTQQNQVLEAIVRAGLDPRDFSWDERGSKYLRFTPSVSRLNHSGGYYFIFDSAEGDYRSSRYSIFSPGSEFREQVEGALTWEDQLRHVAHWLNYLRREIRTPSLWASLSEVRGPLALEGPNAEFTPEEKVEIFRQLGVLQREITAQAQLSVVQQQLLENTLGEIKESVHHLRRHQWFHLAIGAIMHFLFEAHVIQPYAQAIFMKAVTTFQYIVNIPPMLRP